MVRGNSTGHTFTLYLLTPLNIRLHVYISLVYLIWYSYQRPVLKAFLSFKFLLLHTEQKVHISNFCSSALCALICSRLLQRGALCLLNDSKNNFGVQSSQVTFYTVKVLSKKAGVTKNYSQTNRFLQSFKTRAWKWAKGSLPPHTTKSQPNS